MSHPESYEILLVPEFNESGTGAPAPGTAIRSGVVAATGATGSSGYPRYAGDGIEADIDPATRTVEALLVDGAELDYSLSVRIAERAGTTPDGAAETFIDKPAELADKPPKREKSTEQPEEAEAAEPESNPEGADRPEEAGLTEERAERPEQAEGAGPKRDPEGPERPEQAGPTEEQAERPEVTEAPERTEQTERPEKAEGAEPRGRPEGAAAAARRGLAGRADERAELAKEPGEQADRPEAAGPPERPGRDGGHPPDESGEQT